ncbi:hypothetical protein PHLCEN_2v6835 [Hermanssonia centrifuga]|uniref:Uncharacterized protein n=1 Tax=Hermanssonia centrifuga TaxID=98765 RepID=A0A2R6NYC8_9APHY|nr:hypothetical protein PHLCEN_2v6835 [Hermanssonia centrifuga]
MGPTPANAPETVVLWLLVRVNIVHLNYTRTHAYRLLQLAMAPTPANAPETVAVW